MFIKSVKLLERLYSKCINGTYYVTTPVFYVNASPHIGHLYTAVIADAICRYQRLLSPGNVQLCTGTDEHGTKIQQAATFYETPIDEYCNSISETFRQVFQKGSVHYDYFVRTSDENHKKTVCHFWDTLYKNGHIYLSEYNGWYCTADETFLTESQIRLDETTGIRYSIESNSPVEWMEEVNYIFRLTKFQSEILYWLQQKEDRVRPFKFYKILMHLLSEPLNDISVSRPVKRVHWGIPVPGDPSQTVYVWLDALVNYLTATGYPNADFPTLWPPKVQVIGKDILKFHGVYWPAFLIAAGLEPPSQIFVHSHWTVDGQKMSKSKNNVVNPIIAAETYTMEGLRYFLLREGTAHSDSNYSDVKVMRVLNAELADTLGNLLSRVCATSLNPRQIYPRLHRAQLRDIVQTDIGHNLLDSLNQLQVSCEKHYNERSFYLVADCIMATLHVANSFFEHSRPWELKLKMVSDEETKRLNLPIPQCNQNTLHLETIIAMTMDTLRVCGIALQPLLPQLSTKLLDKLNVPQYERMWHNMSDNFVQVFEGKREPPSERALTNVNAVLFKRLALSTNNIMMPIKKQANINTTTSDNSIANEIHQSKCVT